MVRIIPIYKYKPCHQVRPFKSKRSQNSQPDPERGLTYPKNPNPFLRVPGTHPQDISGGRPGFLGLLCSNEPLNFKVLGASKRYHENPAGKQATSHPVRKLDDNLQDGPPQKKTVQKWSQLLGGPIWTIKNQLGLPDQLISPYLKGVIYHLIKKQGCWGKNLPTVNQSEFTGSPSAPVACPKTFEPRKKDYYFPLNPGCFMVVSMWKHELATDFLIPIFQTIQKKIHP